MIGEGEECHEAALLKHGVENSVELVVQQLCWLYYTARFSFQRTKCLFLCLPLPYVIQATQILLQLRKSVNKPPDCE